MRLLIIKRKYNNNQLKNLTAVTDDSGNLANCRIFTEGPQRQALQYLIEMPKYLS